jgi:secreted PhoX family phosphatase
MTSKTNSINDVKLENSLPLPMNRRHFNSGLVTLAFAGLASHLKSTQAGEITSLSKAESTKSQLLSSKNGFGPLVSDPNGILDLPANFNYQVISTFGRLMQDGFTVPDRADGMGCFQGTSNTVVLVRNHELSLPKVGSPVLKLPISKDKQAAQDSHIINRSYDTYLNETPLPGGTSHIVYNLSTQKVESEFMSLLGTVRNCSGGTTPWGTWLTCEESVEKISEQITKDHGYIFEVPANANGLVDAKPLVEMGRFNHEAACVDPASGIVYLTEDRHDSLFYRFIPSQAGKLNAGGKLQALVVKHKAKFDTRNWQGNAFEENQTLSCEWIDLDNVESPLDDLRQRGHEKGAALFARGEGIQFGSDEMYFCCTNGGEQRVGQVMRYVPSKYEGTAGEQNSPGTLSLFVESQSKASFNYGDNITIAPNGHLLVCEDQYTKTVNNHLKGITQKGEIYDFAKVRWQTEPAGACFSPDGSTLFVNLYSPTTTLAIKGPWLA